MPRTKMCPSSTGGMNSRPRSRQGPRDENPERSKDEPAVVEAEGQVPQVAALEKPHQKVIGARGEVAEQKQAHDRSDRERQDESAREREGVGFGHGAEQLPLGP